MGLLDRLRSVPRDSRGIVRPLWRQVVAQARRPEWYREGGVADTLEGRFDMMTLALALVTLRMERSAALAPQTAALTEIFVEEMDGQLRQSGVGDLMVGKQIGRLVSTLGGRIGALRIAMGDAGDALDQVVQRNVTLLETAEVGAICGYLRALAARLEATDDAALLEGELA